MACQSAGSRFGGIAERFPIAEGPLVTDMVIESPAGNREFDVLPGRESERRHTSRR